MKKTMLATVVLFVLLMTGFASAKSYFVILKSTDIDGVNKAVVKLKSSGVLVPHIFPPNAVVADSTSEKVFAGVSEISRYYESQIPDVDISNTADSTMKLIMKAWNYSVTPHGRKALAITPEGLRSAAESCGGAMEFPKPKYVAPAATSSKIVTYYPYKPTTWETSSYLLGATSIKVFHQNTPDAWTEADITTSIAVCQNGMQWWADQNPDAKLTFVWHFETISGSPSVDLQQLRKDDKTDWAFYVLRPHSDGRSNAFYGGPYTTFYMDPRGSCVLTHESGHIYNSYDEYCPDACIPKTSRIGYLSGINTNSDSGGATGISCMMKDLGSLCDFTKVQIGWRDTNANRIPDILEVKPRVYEIVASANPKNYEPFQGKAGVVAYPHANSDGTSGTLTDGYHDITINKIRTIEFRVDGGSWGSCSPIDGSFNDQIEEFTFIPIAHVILPSHSIEIRTTDTAGNISDIVSLTAAELAGQIPPSFVKVYPNPFNPTKEKANIFSGAVGVSLEAYIYSISGEKLRTLKDSDVDVASGMITWDGKTDSGDTCKSGLYLVKVKSSDSSATGKVLVIIN